MCLLVLKASPCMCDAEGISMMSSAAARISPCHSKQPSVISDASVMEGERSSTPSDSPRHRTHSLCNVRHTHTQHSTHCDTLCIAKNIHKCTSVVQYCDMLLFTWHLNLHTFTCTFTCTHLADSVIHSDLQKRNVTNNVTVNNIHSIPC